MRVPITAVSKTATRYSIFENSSRMPSNTEQTINVLLGNLIRARVPKWSDCVAVEQTHVIDSHPGQSPDLLIYGRSAPIVIEAEFLPAKTVIQDARKRLGQLTNWDKRPIEHVLACRYQADLREVDQNHLMSHLEASTFGFQILSTGSSGESIWPEQGYCEGSINDLVDCLEVIGLSESLLDECTDTLELAIRQVEHNFSVLLLMTWQKFCTKSSQTLRSARSARIEWPPQSLPMP